MCMVNINTQYHLVTLIEIDRLHLDLSVKRVK